jgi:replicative DNA helicase
MTQNLQQKIENIITGEETKSIAQLVEENLEQLNSETDQKNVIKTGFGDLDELMGGFRCGEFIVVGGRPGMGKTHLLVNLSLNISKTFPLLYVTFELSEFQLTSRFISFVSEIPVYKMLQHNLNEEQKHKLSTMNDEFAKYQLFIHDCLDLRIATLKAHCQKQVQENGVKVIVIDYLQLITSDMYRKSNRELEISYICRELRSLAKDFNVCIIVSSQLSRNVEMRSASKYPQLSDLRDSGAIEQTADKVLFIYRPEYYGFCEDEEGNSTKNLVTIIVAKNRSGRLGDINLLKNDDFTTLRDFKNEFSFFSNRLNELEEIEIVLNNKMPY